MTTLAKQLQPAAVGFDELDKTYRPMLALVNELIGVVPNCDTLLEIWPPGFRTYNLIVPNFLNLPFTLIGMGGPKDLIGLAMYKSSMAAECPYCSAHTCSFALRRGATQDALFGERTPQQEAVVQVAEALSRIPCDLTTEQVHKLNAHLSPAHAEGVVLSIAMMGFLNKFMDAVGVELEEESLADVGSMLLSVGWKPGKHVDDESQIPSTSNPALVDNLGTYLRVFRHAPAAIRLEGSWTKGVPNQWPQVGEFLTERVGHAYPILSKLTQKNAIRAIATVLRENLDPTHTQIGLAVKALSGLVFATVAQNETLAQEARILATRADASIDEATFDAVVAFAQTEPMANIAAIQQTMATLSALPGLSNRDAAVLVLARAAAPSPAEVTPTVLTEVAPLLNAAMIVEVVVWLSVQQMLHRIERFYAA